jgi:hypothetical protein
MAHRAGTTAAGYLLTMGYRPSFDPVSVAASMPADATRPHVDSFANPLEAPEHYAKLTQKCRKARQTSVPALPFRSAPHRHGGNVSPKTVHPERAMRQ